MIWEIWPVFVTMIVVISINYFPLNYESRIPASLHVSWLFYEFWTLCIKDYIALTSVPFSFLPALWIYFLQVLNMILGDFFLLSLKKFRWFSFAIQNFLHCCSSTVVSIFTPQHPSLHPFPPPTLKPTPFGFVHVSFIHVPSCPPHYQLLSLSLLSAYCQIVLYFNVSCILFACFFD